MGRQCGAAAAMVIALVSLASAQTPEERASARDVIAKHGNAVVFLLGTTKVRVNQGGREVQNQDSRVQTLVTLIDSSGLGVMSLTTLDPSDLMAAQLRGRAGGAAVSVSIEPADLRYRMADGKEVPVRVVLRDKDLDLAFLRPVDKPAEPMPAIDIATARPQPVDLVVVLQRAGEIAGWQSTALLYAVQAVVEKPRTFLILTGGAVGSAVFDTRGRFVGVVLVHKNEANAASAVPIVLPANEIREVAKQAN